MVKTIKGQIILETEQESVVNLGEKDSLSLCVSYWVLKNINDFVPFQADQIV